MVEKLVIENAKYAISYTTKYKKDIKRAKKRGLKIQELYSVITMLAKGEELPEPYKDHPLEGNWAHHRECHIQNDWLLIYQIKEDVLILELTRTGTHSDLF